MFSPSIFEHLTFAIAEEAANKPTNANLYDLIGDPSSQPAPTTHHQPTSTRQQSARSKEPRKAHVSRKGKALGSRTMKPLADCRLRCRQRVPSDERVELFRNYCNLADYDQRAAYISSLFAIASKKSVRPRTDDPDRQKYRVKTHNYHLQLRAARVSVCQRCFLTVFDESDNFIKALAQRKILEEGVDVVGAAPQLRARAQAARRRAELGENVRRAARRSCSD